MVSISATSTPIYSAHTSQPRFRRVNLLLTLELRGVQNGPGISNKDGRPHALSHVHGASKEEARDDGPSTLRWEISSHVPRPPPGMSLEGKYETTLVPIRVQLCIARFLDMGQAPTWRGRSLGLGVL